MMRWKVVNHQRTEVQMELNFTGNAEEDLRALHERVLSGDMPGSRELLAILDSMDGAHDSQ